MCCDSRRSVRLTSITYLQRALLSHDLHDLTGQDWHACFTEVRGEWPQGEGHEGRGHEGRGHKGRSHKSKWGGHRRGEGVITTAQV